MALTAEALGAEPRCGASGRPWVSVAFATPLPRAFEQRVLLDFRAGLESEAIDACREGSGPARAPVAAVRISTRDAASVAVSVDVRDRVTSKRVGRDLDLSRVPVDGRAFAVAVAADELVRASWAELALESSRSHDVPPPEVSAVVARALPRSSSRARAGARAAAESFGGGQTHWGGDAYVRTAVSPRLRLELSLGAREALAVDAPHGSVRGTALGAGAVLDFLVHRTPGFEVAAGLGARAAWMRFEGEARSDGVGGEWAGVALQARATAGVSARLLGPLWAELGGSSGLPVRALEVQDDERVITGTGGLELALGAGLAAAF